MTSFYPMMPSSSPLPSPLTLRRCSTISRPNVQQGLVIEYSFIQPVDNSSQGEIIRQDIPCESKVLPPLRQSTSSAISHTRNHKPWLGLSHAAHSHYDKKRRLARMNLRSETTRVPSSTRPSHNSLRASSSCKQSDSNTNDSQRSALTANSLEERMNEERRKQMRQLELDEKEEVTEEKLERRRNFEKCMTWIEKLPPKFSGMHIVQERAPVSKD